MSQQPTSMEFQQLMSLEAICESPPVRGSLRVSDTNPDHWDELTANWSIVPSWKTATVSPKMDEPSLSLALIHDRRHELDRGIEFDRLVLQYTKMTSKDQRATERALLIGKIRVCARFLLEYELLWRTCLCLEHVSTNEELSYLQTLPDAPPDVLTLIQPSSIDELLNDIQEKITPDYLGRVSPTQFLALDDDHMDDFDN
jgi:hypothetical protein